MPLKTYYEQHVRACNASLKNLLPLGWREVKACGVRVRLKPQVGESSA